MINQSCRRSPRWQRLSRRQPTHPLSSTSAAPAGTASTDRQALAQNRACDRSLPRRRPWHGPAAVSAIQNRPFRKKLADGRDASGRRTIEGFKDMRNLLPAQRNRFFVSKQFRRDLVSVFEHEVVDRVPLQFRRARDDCFPGAVDADAQPAILVRSRALAFRHKAPFSCVPIVHLFRSSAQSVG